MAADEQQIATQQPLETYDASAIKVLEGMEAVRQRPGMFIGDTGVKGLHHLVYEVVDNSIDEAMGGHCKNIHVKLNANGSVTVIDDGRGIPVEMHEQEQRSALEVVMTTLHAGGKFDQKSYSVSAGLHGVGVSAVNALSEWLIAEVWRNGHEYTQKYERGRPVTPVETRGKTDKRGTRVVFKPDPQIFPDTNYVFEVIVNRLRELAFLNSGVRINVSDERTGKSEDFHYDGGIKAFVEHLNHNKKKLHEDIIFFSKMSGKVSVELALQYNDSYNETVFTFANSINTHDGGTHLSGFKTALTRTLNQFARKDNAVKENEDLPSGDDYREGLTAVINVKLPNPQFESQTKVKLTNPDVEGIVTSVTNAELADYLESHPSTGRIIISQAVLAMRARIAAKEARDLTRRKGALAGGDLPGKLADCSSRDVATTELFIVEGDSAGGSAKMGRDRKFQAILPLKGKILNVEKARIDKMLKHDEIRTVISALGTGIGDDEFDIEKLRYGKIILMCDADVDGSHIRTLLLTFFFRHMKSLVERKNVFIAQPPLYKVKRKKKEEYIHSEREMWKVLVDLGLDGTKLAIEPENRELDQDDLRCVVDQVARIEELIDEIQSRGVNVREYLAQYDAAKGMLPIYRIRLDGHEHYFSTDEDLSRFIKETQEREGREFVVYTDDMEVPADKQNVIVINEFHGAREVAKALAEIRSFGFTTEDYLNGAEETGRGRFKLVNEGDTVVINGLRHILKGVRKIGQKGLDVQRYKGLGEMNPDQLWETTMNPETRRILNVTMEDAVRADRMFTILMGDAVEPRRDFIEKHALEVKYLDV